MHENYRNIEAIPIELHGNIFPCLIKKFGEMNVSIPFFTVISVKFFYSFTMKCINVIHFRIGKTNHSPNIYPNAILYRIAIHC